MGTRILGFAEKKMAARHTLSDKDYESGRNIDLTAVMLVSGLELARYRETNNKHAMGEGQSVRTTWT